MTLRLFRSQFILQRSPRVNYFLSCMFHRASKLTEKCQHTKVGKCLLHPVQCEETAKRRKVTVIGAAGDVGTACAISLVLTNTCDEIVLVDIESKKDKLRGEMLDMTHVSSVRPMPKIIMCLDYKHIAGSQVIIISAGLPRKKGQNRLDLINDNIQIFKNIIPCAVKESPDAVIIIISNPVDILSYASWRLSGFDVGRIISTGTELDSSRFRYYISQRLGVSPRSVGGWIVGEHGDSSVALWSSVTVGGMRLRDIDSLIGTPCDPDNWLEVHNQTIQAGYEVHGLKGCTNWGVSTIAVRLTQAVLTDAQTIHCVSTLPTGHYGLNTECFLSLPCVLGNRGVVQVVNGYITSQESECLQKSACALEKVKNTIKF